jgi:integrase
MPLVKIPAIKAPTVSLYIRVTDAKGRRHYEPLITSRFKARSPQPCGPRDNYALLYYVPKMTWEQVGQDYNEAARKRSAKEQELLCAKREKSAQPTPPQTPVTLEEQKIAFLHDKRTSRKKDGTLRDPETITSYDQTIEQFLSATGAQLITDVTRDVLRKWKDALYQHPYAHWTVCNIYSEIATFLKFGGVDHKQLLREDERPTPHEETPEAYTKEQMDRLFFGIADEKDELFFRFLLVTGPREKEATHLEPGDLNLGDNPTVRFWCSKGFLTKTRKNRTVPLERGLADRLMVWLEKNPGKRYVFGRAKDQPEGHYLRKLHQYAKQAGMDKERFWLHKFRDTFATWALRRGVDLRTVQPLDVRALFLERRERLSMRGLADR